jgi:hypothetical protein
VISLIWVEEVIETAKPSFAISSRIRSSRFPGGVWRIVFISGVIRSKSCVYQLESHIIRMGQAYLLSLGSLGRFETCLAVSYCRSLDREDIPVRQNWQRDP